MTRDRQRFVASGLPAVSAAERALGFDDAPTLVEESAPASVRPAASALPALPAEDRYERVGLLGVGGMAEVYLVKDRAIGRAVAMKVLDMSHAHSVQFRARFVREARVQSQLQHPGVVPVYDISKDARGAEFFTMKSVTGVTLQNVLDKAAHGDPDTIKRFPRRRLLAIFRQVCLCVEYAHSRGVIHRDLKPANVMIGNFGEVYVLDWGISKVVAEASGVAEGDRRAKTLQGQMLGTPGYMAPEQAGSPDVVDQRSDVYALGSMLFEILTLERLHRGDHAFELLHSTQVGIVARPSERAPERDIPPELDAICVKAAALDPAARHSSARELVDDLDRFLEGDRNVQIRQKLAERHARAAEEAAAIWQKSGDENRRNLAVQEAGRAVALDPESPVATSVLLQALLEPGRELPEVARDAITREIANEAVFAGRLGIVVYGGFLILAALLFFEVGVRSWGWVIALMASLLVTVVLCIYGATRPADRPRIKVALAVVVCSSLAIAAASGIYGSFVLVPTLATANTLALNIGSLRQHRWFALLTGCASFAVPYLLQWSGILGDPAEFRAGTIAIHAVASGIRPSSAYHLLGLSLAAIVGPALAVWRLDDRLASLRQRLVVQLWHLQNVVPSSAMTSLVPESPRPVRGRGF